jgi:hypothetical protein
MTELLADTFSRATGATAGNSAFTSALSGMQPVPIPTEMMNRNPNHEASATQIPE